MKKKVKRLLTCPECNEVNGRHEEWCSFGRCWLSEWLKRWLWLTLFIALIIIPAVRSQVVADEYEGKAFVAGQVFWALRKSNLLNEENVDYAEELFKYKAFESLREEYGQFDLEVADTAFEEGAQSVGEEAY